MEGGKEGGRKEKREGENLLPIPMGGNTVKSRQLL